MRIVFLISMYECLHACEFYIFTLSVSFLWNILIMDRHFCNGCSMYSFTFFSIFKSFCFYPFETELLIKKVLESRKCCCSRKSLTRLSKYISTYSKCFSLFFIWFNMNWKSVWKICFKHFLIIYSLVSIYIDIFYELCNFWFLIISADKSKFFDNFLGMISSRLRSKNKWYFTTNCLWQIRVIDERISQKSIHMPTRSMSKRVFSDYWVMWLYPEHCFTHKTSYLSESSCINMRNIKLFPMEHF